MEPEYIKFSANGKELTMGQCMVIHVALQEYATWMGKKNALGKDATGEAIRKSYLNQIQGIYKVANTPNIH